MPAEVVERRFCPGWQGVDTEIISAAKFLMLRKQTVELGAQLPLHLGKINGRSAAGTG